MALTLIQTAGSTTANVYVTLADAKTYMEGYISALTSAWDAVTDAERNEALVHATKQIDMHRLSGSKYYPYIEGETSYQPLHFPVEDDEYDGSPYIPAKVQEACAVQAAFLLRQGTAIQAAMDLVQTGIKSQTLGKFSQEYTQGNASVLCQEARHLLSEWIITSKRVERC